jgi:hypothetical protein
MSRSAFKFARLLLGGSLALSPGSAAAGDWTKTTDPWPIRSNLGPPHVFPQQWVHLVDRCYPGSQADANGEAVGGPNRCLYADAGRTWPSDHPAFTCETSLAVVDRAEYVLVALRFDPGSKDGFTRWPKAHQWPKTVSCSRTFGPYTHTYEVPVAQVSAPAVRTALPVVTRPVSWSSTLSLGTIPAAWKGFVYTKFVRIPNGNYSGPSTAKTVPMTTTAANTTDYPQTACFVLDQNQAAGYDDFLAVSVQYGIGGRGEAFCPVTRNGSPRDLRVTFAF